MTRTEKLLVELIQELPPAMQAEVRDFVEFLLVKQARSTTAEGWPEGYFEKVIGSLPDFPESDGVADGIDSTYDDSDDMLRF